MADLSGRYSPQEWASRAINAYHVHRADKVVIDTNIGGDMAHQTLLTVDRNIPVSRIHAKRGKVTRAEPIASLYEQGRVSHVGMFEALEDQMCSFAPGSTGGADDRVDAMVYALSELMGGYQQPMSFHVPPEAPGRTQFLAHYGAGLLGATAGDCDMPPGGWPHGTSAAGFAHWTPNSSRRQ